MYYPFYTRSLNLLPITLPSMLVSTQYYLRRKIENSNSIYDIDVYEPYN